MTGPRLALTALLFAGAARAQPPADAVPAQNPRELAERLEAAWSARDLAGYLGLWRFASESDREEETAHASSHFAAERSDLTVGRPLAPGRRPLTSAAQVFTVSEPRGRLEQWLYRFEPAPDGWRVAAREPLGRIDNLVHLSLDPQPYRAAGMVLRLEDFDLEMRKGALFSAPATLGPTLLVFVGEGTVHVRPRPEAERAQMQEFAGRPELHASVSAALIRIHPADLHRFLAPARLQPEPAGARHLAQARRFYDEQVDRSFVLDANLPGSPWWLLPGLGDASVTFRAGRRGTLTYALSTAEPESISLFDRARRRQILLYPSAGGSTDYDEDARREFDLLRHDLAVRFEPSRSFIAGEDTLTVRLLTPTPTVRLRLHADLRVESIRSPDAGELLFFRVRHQDTVMVSLGPLAAATDEVALTVRYSGVHPPTPVEDEVVQVRELPDEELMIENVLVYTNRTAWYPRGGIDDHALATLRFDVPLGYTVVAGGTRVVARAEGNRVLLQYEQDRPGKYISVAVGRLAEVGRRADGPVTLQAWAVGRARGEAAEVMDLAGEILGFYAGEFGPCPYPLLNLAIIEGFAPGGHSPPGMIVLVVRPLLLRRNLRDDPANFSDLPGFFLAHELAHQWWGHGVAGRNYRERWLSEAFAQYAAALWVRHRHGERTFRDMMGRMARWALRMEERGPIHLGHRLGHIKGDPQVYRAIVYNKGAFVLHMLRGVVGEEAFRRALADFQSTHRFGKAGTADLRRALEGASGRDLGPYFQTWVHETALPRITYSARSARFAAGYRTTVEARAAGLPGPVPLTVTLVTRTGREDRVLPLAPGDNAWTFETATRPRVELNADRGLLARVERR
ncbi:MAG TPA: M1 family aminopeptidase [Vicinamibacteria bacterium]|nr:M1 family aminopeptidase [Vicinamibacteria bacterium]